MSLRDLDARLVPRMAALLRRALDGTTGAGHAAVASAAGAGSALRRLDDRYTRHGPLKLLREVPQLGLLLVAALFLAGAGAAVALSGPEPLREQQQAGGAQDEQEDLPLVLGPGVGDDIEEHFALARERLAALAEDDPEAEHLALVSLNKGLTPAEVDELVGGPLALRRAYVRAPLPTPTEEIAVDVQRDALGTLRAVFAQTAARKAEEQEEFLSLARSIESATPEEAAFRAQYEADARLAGQEAAAFRTECACVYALVLEGPVGELAELPALPVVRGVEVAPRSAELAALDIRPLAPIEQGVVSPDVRPESDGA